MWRILIRVLPVVVLSILFSIFIVIVSVYYFYADRIEKLIDDEIAEQSLLISHYLDKNLPKAEWEARFKKLQAASVYHIEIKPISELPAISSIKQQRFMQGEVIAITGMDWVFIDHTFAMRIGDSQEMLYWMEDEGDELELLSDLMSFAILGIILLMISFWVYLHWAELQRLMLATDKIGSGDFSARVVEKKYSSSYPFSRRINQMAAYIERLINGQRELIHSVSHELRTPISRLDFGLELLKQSTDNSKLLNRITDMESDVAELNRLVEELLQLATVGQQYKKQLVEFDFNALIRYCTQLIKYDIRRIRVTLNLPDGSSEYVGDMRLLERVINNLLSNAVKYALQHIKVSLIKETYHYILTVEDDGKGIPPIERQRIFEPFYRLEDSWDKKTHGYGLGLAMVQRIVQVHNGQVMIEDSCWGGAKLIVYLPLES